MACSTLDRTSLAAFVCAAAAPIPPTPPAGAWVVVISGTALVAPATSPSRGGLLWFRGDNLGAVGLKPLVAWWSLLLTELLPLASAAQETIDTRRITTRRERPLESTCARPLLLRQQGTTFHSPSCCFSFHLYCHPCRAENIDMTDISSEMSSFRPESGCGWYNPCVDKGKSATLGW